VHFVDIWLVQLHRRSVSLQVGIGSIEDDGRYGTTKYCCGRLASTQSNQDFWMIEILTWPESKVIGALSCVSARL
jgi:hypothetical protein